MLNSEDIATVSYVWVDNSTKKGKENQIPCTEEGHGIKNVISNEEKTSGITPDASGITPDAEKTGNVKHCIYVDRLTDGKTTFDPSITLPSNVEFRTVDSLFDECTALIKENEAKGCEWLIEGMREIYDAEMQYGKPAFAGNIVKFLALYKGEIVCDIGCAIIGEEVIRDLNQFDRLKDSSSYVFIEEKNDKGKQIAGTYQFMHLPKNSTLTLCMMQLLHILYTSDYLQYENAAIIQKNTRNNYCNNEDYKYEYPIISPEDFVKQAMLIQKEKGYNLQDSAYAKACTVMASKLASGTKLIKYKSEDFVWTHKLSHRAPPKEPHTPILSQKTAPFPKQEFQLDEASGTSQAANQAKPQDDNKKQKIAFIKENGKSFLASAEKERNKRGNLGLCSIS